MIDTGNTPPAALGFLTVVAEPQQGLIGGYLLTTARARPLEFHCTVPLRANRAQEILYGPTLPPFLYGEQIGATLVQAAKIRPLAVFTDCAPALAAAGYIDIPLWLVLPPAIDAPVESAPATSPLETSCSGSANALGMVAGGPAYGSGPHITSATGGVSIRTDSAHELPAGLKLFTYGQNRLAGQPPQAQARRLVSGVLGAQPTDREQLEGSLAEIAAGLDLSEPFDRIRAAIQEAQRGGR